MTVEKDPIKLFAKSVADTIMKIENDNKAYNEIMLKADEIEKLEKKLDKLYKEQRQRLSKEMTKRGLL